MRDILTMPTIKKKHPNSFVICLVAHRDAETNKPKTFKVLQTVRDTASMIKALDFYDAEGFEGVFALNNFNEGNSYRPEFPPHIAARMFRTMYH